TDLTALPPAEAQRAIVVHQLGRARAGAEGRERIDGVLGQSLGEVSALVVAGALSEEDGLRFVRLRAALPARLLPPRPWTMASMTRLRPAAAEEATEGLDVWVAGRNGPADCVVVGASGDFATFVERVGALPQTYRELPVTAPYHTPVMAPVAEALAAEVAGFDVRDPAVPVWSPTGVTE